MSLQHAITAAPKEFINEPLTGTIKFTREVKGSTGSFFTCLIEDGADKLNLSSNADLFSAWNNQRVTISINGSGKGFSMQRKPDYNDKPQASIGINASVDKAANVEPAASNPRNSVTPSSSSALNTKELAKAWADMSKEVYDAFSGNFGSEVAELAALKAPEWAALHWFGEKQVPVAGADEEIPEPEKPAVDPEAPSDDEAPF